MKLTAAIAAHPVRGDYARGIQRTLDRAVPLVFDHVETPSADPMQRWITHRRAWEAALEADTAAKGVLILQDDVRIPSHLLAGLEHALDQFPDAFTDKPEFLVSAYTGTGRPDQKNVRRALAQADRLGESWIRTRSLNWGPAICVPAWTVPDMLEAVERHIRSHRPPRSNTDYAIGVYYRDVLGWATHYTVPSLVEHRRIPSLVGHDTGPIRRAHRFIGEGTSALSVDWSRAPRGGLITPLPSR